VEELTMANVIEVPAEHRKHARTVPAHILERLHPAELRLRCAEMARLHEAAALAQAEHARYLTARARKVARAMPVAAFIEMKRKLHDQAHNASHEPVVLPGHVLPTSEASMLHQAKLDLEDEHRYPAGLVAAVDQAFLGKATTPEAQAIHDHHKARGQ
jgi:hypothetical protein